MSRYVDQSLIGKKVVLAHDTRLGVRILVGTLLIDRTGDICINYASGSDPIIAIRTQEGYMYYNSIIGVISHN